MFNRFSITLKRVRASKISSVALLKDINSGLISFFQVLTSFEAINRSRGFSV